MNNTEQNREEDGNIKNGNFVITASTTTYFLQQLLARPVAISTFEIVFFISRHQQLRVLILFQSLA
jgi:hypothetical protein